MKVKKAIIMAAGLGTHFLPATRAIPKEMLPVVDKPVIQYLVEEIVEAGIEEILIITGRNKNMIEDHFDHAFELETTLKERDDHELLETTLSVSDLANIHFIRQKKELGTGHALLKARAFVGNEPFAVLCGDDLVDASCEPCIKQLMNSYELLGHTVLALCEQPKDKPHDYGVIEGEKNEDGFYEVSGIAEKYEITAASQNTKMVGRYVLRPEIFDYIEVIYDRSPENVPLNEALNMLSHDQRVYGVCFEGKHYDIGTKAGYVQATLDFALKRDEMKNSILEQMSTAVEAYRQGAQ